MNFDFFYCFSTLIMSLNSENFILFITLSLLYLLVFCQKHLISVFSLVLLRISTKAIAVSLSDKNLFFTKGSTTFIKWASDFSYDPKTPPDCLILRNYAFKNFKSAKYFFLCSFTCASIKSKLVREFGESFSDMLLDTLKRTLIEIWKSPYMFVFI